MDVYLCVVIIQVFGVGGGTYMHFQQIEMIVENYLVF